jgi:hypothetical protein
MACLAYALSPDGTVSNRKILVNWPSNDGCDGMTVDVEGNLYIAVRSEAAPDKALGELRRAYTAKGIKSVMCSSMSARAVRARGHRAQCAGEAAGLSFSVHSHMLRHSTGIVGVFVSGGAAGPVCTR